MHIKGVFFDGAVCDVEGDKELAYNKVPKLHSTQMIQLNRGGVPSATPQDQCRSWENTPDSLTLNPATNF